MAKLGRSPDPTKLGPGRHSDGAGLYLMVEKPKGDRAPTARWTGRVYDAGKPRDIGLGSLATVTAPQARLALAAIKERLSRGEPIRPKAEPAPAAGDTFKGFIDRWLPTRLERLKNPTDVRQWKRTFAVDLEPLHGRPLAEITTAEVVDLLAPLWSRATADRTRNRLEIALDAATALGLRTGENPARWRGRLQHLLAAPPAKADQVHHAALTVAEAPAFARHLRTPDRPVKLACLEWLLLTASRSAEARGARWSEITGDVWTVPASRMKAGAAHVVPLTPRLLEILDEMRDHATGDLIFPGRSGTLSNSTLQNAPAASWREKTTLHGLRAVFRSWAAETRQDRDLAEMALAHKVGSDVERAYQRSGLIEARRALLEIWSAYLA